ncbi:MAG: MoaD/ThiS family protein [Actinobacteria bacterium]|nr:MoaD/ThiS family protein [Actinomycetota bacterium]
MSVRVKIPTQLRALTGGAQEVPARGTTVAELVADLEAQHPGMRERLMDGSGSLRRFVNVYIDDEDVRFLKGLDTEVGDGARVSIIPAVAGGSSGARSARYPGL